MTPDEADASQRRADNFSKGFGVAIFVIACGVAYWMWPSGITDQTLSATTIGQTLRALGSVVAVVAGLYLAALLWI